MDVTRAEQAAFGSGALVTGIFVTVPGLILLYYLTDTLGVAAGLAGLVVALPRLLDLVANPLAGRLSDRTTGRWGPRRPWIAAGGAALPLTFVLIFWSPVTGVAAAAWVAVAFALAGVCFSAFVVPWSALPAEVTDDNTVRAKMISWRVAFLAVAILLSGGLVPAIVAFGGGGAAGYRWMAVTMAAVMLVAAFVTVTVGARRSVATTADTSGSMADAWRVIRDNPTLRTVLGVVLLCEIASATALASVPYIADHVVGDAEAVTVVFVCVVAPMLLVVPVWTRVAVRRGTGVALRRATGFFAVGAALLAPLPAISVDIRLPAALVATVIVGIGLAGTTMLPLTMLADTVASMAAESGLRQAGLVNGAANAVETVAGSAGAGLYALLLAVSGFVSSEANEAVTQSITTQFGIVLAVAAVAAAVLLGVHILLRGFVGESADEKPRVVEGAA